MARVKSPLLSLQAAGSVGGITVCNTSSGPAIKTIPIPNDSIKGFRPTIRSIMSYLSKKWGGLTDAQRASWEAYAQEHQGIDKFGDPFTMSGINMYVKINLTAVRLFGAGSEASLPPVDNPASEGLVLTATAGTNPGEIDLNWTELGTGVAADKWEIQMAGPFQSPGRVEVQSRFAYLTETAGNVLTKVNTGLNEGFWYWFRVRYVTAEGQVTPWIYDQQTPQVTP